MNGRKRNELKSQSIKNSVMRMTKRNEFANNI